MVELTGICLLGALVWLLAYGMSATDAEGHQTAAPQAEKTTTKHAA